MSAVALALSLGLVRPADESGPRLTRAMIGTWPGAREAANSVHEG